MADDFDKQLEDAASQFTVNQYGDLVPAGLPPDAQQAGPLQIAQAAKDRAEAKANASAEDKDEAVAQAMQPSNMAPGTTVGPQANTPLGLQALATKALVDKAAQNAPTPPAADSLPAPVKAAMGAALSPGTTPTPASTPARRAAASPAAAQASAPSGALPDTLEGLDQEGALSSAIKNVDFTPAEKAEKKDEDETKTAEQRVKDLLAQRTELLKKTEGGRRAETAANILQSIPFLNLFAAPIARGIAGGMNAPLTEFDQAHPELAGLQGASDEQIAATVGKQRQEAAANSPTSSVTLQAQNLMSKATGLPLTSFQGLPASQLSPLFQHVMQLPADERKEAAKNLVDKYKADQEAKTAAAGQKVTERGQNIGLQEEREREKGEMERAALTKQLALAQGKPIPDQMVPKIGAEVDAPALLNELRQKHANIGLSGPLSALPFVPTFGAAKEYQNAVKASAGPLGLAMYPGARSESPELTKMAMDALPKAYTLSGTAENQLGNIGRNSERALTTQLKALAAGGASPREIEAYRQQFLQNSAPAAQTGGAVPAAAHPNAAKALEWARANPRDPDAQAILARFGGG